MAQGFSKTQKSIFILLIALSVPLVLWADPKIYTPEPNVDFGKRLASDPLEHDFIIQNIGDGILILNGFSNPCGCTTTTIGDDTLKAGEETIVHVQLRPMGNGRVDRTVTLISNDPVLKGLPLHFTGEFISDVVIEPVSQLLTLIEDDSLFEKPIMVYSGMDEIEFSIVGEIETNVSWLGFDVECINPKKSYRIIPKVLSRPPAGMVAVSITIRTDHPEAPELISNITGTVVGDYTVMPDTVRYVYEANKTEPITYEFSVMAGRLGAFQIIEAISPREDLKIEMSTNEDKSAYRFKVTGIPVNDLSLSGKEILLKTNLDVPVRVPIDIIQDSK